MADSTPPGSRVRPLDPKAIERRLAETDQRLHDLAKDQHRLHTQLAGLLAAVDALRSTDTAPNPSTPAVPAAIAPPSSEPEPPLWRKVLRRGLAIVRAIVHRGNPPPELRFDLAVGDAARALPEPGDILVDDPGNFPHLMELLRLTFAAEAVDFVEVWGDDSSAFAVRRELWGESSGKVAYANLPRRRGRTVLGKIIDLGGRSGAPRASLRPDDFRSGHYRLASGPTPRTLTLHSLEAVSVAPRGDVDGPTTLLLVDTLLAGRDRWVAEQLSTAPERHWAVAVLRPCTPLDADRCGLLQATHPSVPVYPLGDWLAEPVASSAVVPIAQTHRVDRIVHLETLTAAEVVGLQHALPEVVIDGAPAGDAGWIVRGSVPTPSATNTDTHTGSAAGQALRRDLGVADGEWLVVCHSDLVPEARPEDFVHLARHWRDSDAVNTDIEDTNSKAATFLLVGRGPQAGTVDDLARYLGLDNLHRRESIPLETAINAADVWVDPAESAPLPYGTVAALDHRVPVLAAAPELKSVVDDDGRSVHVSVGDIEAMAEALGHMSDP